MDFASHAHVKDWIYKNQIDDRRNLTENEVTYYMGKRYENQKEMNRGVDHRSEDAKNQSSQNGNIEKSAATSKKIAKECDVSKNTVLRAADFCKGVDTIKETVPEVAE